MMNIVGYIDAHTPNVALQFSGGRDSLAMLLLLKNHLHKLTVYFCNSGDAYPETLALVQEVKKLVPNFVEIKSNSPQTIKENGWPTDVLQAGAQWPFGKEQIKDHLKLNDRYSCCYQTIMKPLHDTMRANGVTLILRGQRDVDEPKSHITSGTVIDGFTIVYPLVDWTDRQVDDFIDSTGVPAPPFYKAGLTSTPDCMHCTAWLEHNAYKYLKQNYPIVAMEVKGRLQKIRCVVEPFVNRLNETLQEDFT